MVDDDDDIQNVRISLDEEEKKGHPMLGSPTHYVALDEKFFLLIDLRITIINRIFRQVTLLTKYVI